MFNWARGMVLLVPRSVARQREACRTSGCGLQCLQPWLDPGAGVGSRRTLICPPSTERTNRSAKAQESPKPTPGFSAFRTADPKHDWLGLESS